MISESKKFIKNEPKKVLFSRKSKLVEEDLSIKKGDYLAEKRK